MPATTAQIDDARAKVQARADSEGSNGAKYTFGSPGSVIEIGERVGNLEGGQSWQSGGGVGPMEILLRGILDSMLDVVLRDIEPVGTIKMFNGLAGEIPGGWAVCDGSQGTPDLRNRFIMGGDSAGGTGGDSDTGLPDDSDTTQPSESFTSATADHTTVKEGTGLDRLLPSAGHLHPMPHFHTAAHRHPHTPPYYKLIFIMKIAT